MNTYLLKNLDMDMDMNWLAHDDYHSSLGRLIPLYSFWDR